MTDETRAVLFDFGGVIIRQDWDQYEAFGRRWDLPEGELVRAFYRTEEFQRFQTGGSDREAWRRSVRSELQPHLGERTDQMLAEWWSRPVELHHANIDLARALRQAGVRIGVLSNAGADLERDLHDVFGVDVEWDALIVSGVVGVAKPDAAIYRLAAERVGLAPEACFFIDDLRRNVRGAVEAGMQAHHFQGDYAALQDDLHAAGYSW